MFVVPPRGLDVCCGRMLIFHRPKTGLLHVGVEEVISAMSELDSGVNYWPAGSGTTVGRALLCFLEDIMRFGDAR